LAFSLTTYFFTGISFVDMMTAPAQMVARASESQNQTQFKFIEAGE
jgi:hypothetical protein